MDDTARAAPPPPALMPVRALSTWSAARKGDVTSLASLLALGESVNKENTMYELPLHLAALEGHAAVVQMLLDNGSVVNAVDGALRSPLHAAVSRGHIIVINILLERGADVQLQDETGLSPIDIARERKDHLSESLLVTADDPVPCQSGCGRVLLRRLISSHTAKDCPYRAVPCRFLCGESVAFADLLRHEADSCVESEIICPGGCGARCRRRDMRLHLELSCPAVSAAPCRFGCRVLIPDRHSHELGHLDKPGSLWSAAEWCFWAEITLTQAVGEKENPSLLPSGTGGDAFLGVGIRTSKPEVHVATIYNVAEAMKEFAVNGHTFAQMAAHPYPKDAVAYLLKALGVLAQFRLILTSAWLLRCDDDGSTALERAKPSLPFAVGTPAMYKVIGDIPITPGTSLADVRRIVDTNPAFEPYLPQKYLLVSCQFNRPVPEPYEGRYLASAMCFVILAQSADARILTTLPTTTPAKPEAGTPVSTVPPTGVPPSPPVRGKLSLPK